MPDPSTYDPIFDAAANEWNVDPRLLKAVAMQESSGNPGTVSTAGARGLMGIMPETGKGLGITDQSDPAQNIFAGAKYLSEALDKEGSPEQALLYYHGGPDWRKNFGPESRGYVPAVASRFLTLAKADQPTGTVGSAAPAPTPAATTTLDPYADFRAQTGATPGAAAGGDDDPDYAQFRAQTGAVAPPVETPPPAPLPQVDIYGNPVGDTGPLEDAGAAAARSYRAAGSLHNWLAPAPNTEYGDVLPFAKDRTTGELRWALPNALRTPLYGATEPIQDAATWNPATGTFGVTPEVAAAVQAFGARPLDVGNPLSAPLPDITQPAPLEGVSPLLPDVAARAAERPTGPTSAVPPTTETPPAPAPVDITAPVSAAPVTTAAQAKQVASAYYDAASSAGGTLTPDFVNKFIDSVESTLPQTEAGQAVGGQSPTSALVERLQALRDKPMTLQGVQEVDEALGGLIDKEYGVKGLSKDGKNLADIQSTFRDQISNAGSDDVTGGTAGFDALGPARKAWSQAMKMDDLERIQLRATMTDNPATSIKTQIRTLLANRSKSRGYDDDETAALQAATQRGTLGGLLHVFGSRLVPLAAGAAEAGAHGMASGLIAAGVSHLGSAKLRGWATTLQENRLRNAMDVLGQGVPPNPLNQPP